MSIYSDNQVFNFKQKDTLYTIIVCFYALLLISAQVMGHRMLSVFGLFEPGGIFIFPLTYTICDVITEVYGLKAAKEAIYIAVAMQAFFTLFTMMVAFLPQPPGWVENNEAYKKVFSYSAIVFVSNVGAVLVSSIYNAKIMDSLKRKFMKSFRFGIRSFISTTVGEAISTAVIVAISFGFTFSAHDTFTLFINMMLFKIAYAFIAIFPASFIVNKISQSNTYKHVHATT